MHFSSIHQGGGPRFGKLAIVAALHVAVGAVFIHTLNTRAVALPHMPAELVLMLTPEAPPPPPPPPPTLPMPTTLAPPQVIAPPVEVLVQQAPPPNNISVDVSTATAPQPPTPPAAADAGPATAAPGPAGVRSVALADASGCATPNYPARAARNNESGTVILALLVGTNGRVGDARIDSTSGSRELDKAAIAALSTCTFKPAMNGGVAEPGWARIAYVWTLEN